MIHDWEKRHADFERRREAFEREFDAAWKRAKWMIPLAWLIGLGVLSFLLYMVWLIVIWRISG
jgi:polyferredoxin